MKPTLTYETPNFYEEAGAIHSACKRLEELGIKVLFQDSGIQIGTTFDKSFNTDYYLTSSELFSYLKGLEDGFWAAKHGKTLFVEKD